MEIFATSRLCVRPYGFGDIDALIDFYSRPEVTHFLGAKAAIHDRAGAEAKLAVLAERHSNYGTLPYGYWAVTEPDGRVVGTTMLKPAPDAARVPTSDIEIGWHLHPSVWGRGYATELAKALTERYFTRTNGGHLIALVDEGNEKSAAVARRTGLVYDGVSERYYGLRLRRYVIDRASWERRALRRAWSVAIFARHEARVLLVKHKRLGTWLPVGGEVEAHETPIEAARRELHEETGLEGVFPANDALEGASPGLIGYEEHVAGKKGVHLNFSFVADVPHRRVTLDDSLDGHVWASLEDGPWGEAPANVRQLAERALSAGSSK